MWQAPASPELRAGIRAAKKWLRKNGYMTMGEEGFAAAGEILEGMIVDAEFVYEVRVQVVTGQTLSSAKSREAMYEANDWKEKAKGSRSIVLFVPRRLRLTAHQFLGLFDDYIEY